MTLRKILHTLTQFLFSYSANKQLLLYVPIKSETCPQKSVVPSQKIDYFCKQRLPVNKCNNIFILLVFGHFGRFLPDANKLFGIDFVLFPRIQEQNSESRGKTAELA